MSALSPSSKKAIDTLRQNHPDWGYVKVARALNLGEGATRYYMAKADSIEYLEPRPLSICVWDLETTHLKPDMGTLLMGCFLDLNSNRMNTIRIRTSPDDCVQDREREVIDKIRDIYDRYDILIGHNSLAFDYAWIRGVSERHGLTRPPKRFHLDTKTIAQYGLKAALQSYSLDNLADFFGVGVKDRPSKHDWRHANLLDEEALERVRLRCESDVRLTAAVWERLREHWFAWKGV